MRVGNGFFFLLFGTFIQLLLYATPFTNDQQIGKSRRSNLQSVNMNTRGASWMKSSLESAHKRTPVRRRRTTSPRLWPRVTIDVPYEIQGSIFTESDIKQIREAMTEFEKYTCIRFRQSNTAIDRVVFRDGGGCYSNTGYGREIRNVSLARGCRRKNIILHELGHIIGLIHEHQRSDRDEYVLIRHENISPYFGNDFMKLKVTTFDMPYDYFSIMHFGGKSFSKNGKLTIVTRDPKYQNIIGTASTLSFGDIRRANFMYRCAERNNCHAKTCPSIGFTGPDCVCWCRGSPLIKCSNVSRMEEEVSLGVVPTLSTSQVPTSSKTVTHVQEEDLDTITDIRTTFNNKTEQPSDTAYYEWTVGVTFTAGGIFFCLTVVVPCIIWKRRSVFIMKVIHRFQAYQDDDMREFDAFISYCSTDEDEHFVVHTLFPKLEKELGFKTCVHFRDFVPGETIANNIIWAVENSHRTILVLTSAYINSEFCRFEYQRAQHEMLKQKQRIIPVILEDISTARDDMDETMKTILSSVTYIEWPGTTNPESVDVFWKKLGQCMPKVRPHSVIVSAL